MAGKQIVWKRCNAGWWDAERDNHYTGWSVARQCRVRVVGNRPEQYDCGWYVFNDETAQMIGPFDTPAAAKESCPLIAKTKTRRKRR
jgi:hypothetical protein